MELLSETDLSIASIAMVLTYGLLTFPNFSKNGQELLPAISVMPTKKSFQVKFPKSSP